MATLRQISDEIASALERPFDTMFKERIKSIFRHELANTIRQEVNKFGIEAQFRQRVIVDLEEVNRPDNPYNSNIKCLRSVNKINLIRYKTDDPFIGVYNNTGTKPYIYTKLSELEFADLLPAIIRSSLPKKPVLKSILTNNAIVTTKGLTPVNVTFTDGLAIFDGSTSYIKLNDTFESVFQKPFSLFFKIDINDGIPIADSTILGVINTSSGYSVILKINTIGQLSLYWGNNSIGYFKYNTINAMFEDGTTTDNTIAVTVSNMKCRMYFNGIRKDIGFQDSVNVDNIDLSLFSNTTQYVYIGATNNNGTISGVDPVNYIDCSIHHFGIYDYVLTEKNIQSLTNNFRHISKPVRYDYINNYLYIYDRDTAESGTDRAILDGIFSSYGFAYPIESADNITNDNAYYDDVEYPMSDDLIQLVKSKLLNGELSMIDNKNKINPTHIDNN